MADGEGVNYDTKKLDIDPLSLSKTAADLKKKEEEIARCLKEILDVLGSLDLNWAGQSAEMYQEVQNEWGRVTKNLFGTEKKPQEGVLGALRGGVSAAITNYSKAEHGNHQAFKDFLAHINDGSGEEGGPQDQTDREMSAVSTDYPDN